MFVKTMDLYKTAKKICTRVIIVVSRMVELGFFFIYTVLLIFFNF